MKAHVWCTSNSDLLGTHRHQLTDASCIVFRHYSTLPVLLSGVRAESSFRNDPITPIRSSGPGACQFSIWPAEGGFCTFQPVVDGGPARGIWTATTATSSCSLARICCIGDANASSGDNWPRAPPTTPPPNTCTAISNPPRVPSTAWKEHWPASAYWIKPSPWTCASHRTTSAECGRPRFAPPILPIPPPMATTTTGEHRRRTGRLR